MKSVFRKSVVGSAVLFAASCNLQNSGPIVKPVAWVLDEGLCEPETVVPAPDWDELIVSNICGFKENGKGYLSKVSRDGKMIKPRWVEGLNAPAGMVRTQTTLFVVDLDRVHRIDIKTGKVTSMLGPFEGARAFNDIAMSHDGDIYVSDSAHGHVLKIKNGEASVFPTADTKFEFANGMHIQEGVLYVGGRTLWEVDLKTDVIRELNYDGVTDIDGIEGDGAGGLSVSIVGGNVWHLPSQGLPQEWTAEGVSSTNHAHLPLSNLIIVPTGYDNTIVAFNP